MRQNSSKMNCASVPSNATEAKGTIYHGVKKLWNAEISQWYEGLKNAQYSLYLVPNSKYNLQEHWVVFSEDDLPTLKQYLVDNQRPTDFKNKQKIC